MKKIILTFLLLFVGVAAFAQTTTLQATTVENTEHKQRAEFMTSQMEALITDMKPKQKIAINELNERYFEKEIPLARRMANVTNPQREVKLNDLNARLHQEYKKRMKENLSSSQYTLFTQNLESLLVGVKNEFGE
ncbi:hypothetical protein [Bernardetia sp.]|uniref:hypothetical protein n=1 Tax=Bernardetia sp. TaxID=1937974 RepID=UPI0025C39739|nr:hypothetical protein [Bernardetia sp.]